MNKIFITTLLGAVLAFGSFSVSEAASTPVACQSIDASTMTVEQIESLKTLCTKDPTQIAASVTPTEVKAWAGIAKDFSSAVVDTARGLGVAVNEFLFTPVGFLLAFYFMWDMIGGILIGIPILFALWIVYFKVGMIISTSSVEYERVPVLWGLFNFKKVKSRIYNDFNDTSVWWIAAGAVALVLSIIDIGVLIF